MVCGMKCLRVLAPLALCGLLIVLFKHSAAVAERYDLVIENARLVDGTGGPMGMGSVAIRDGRIAALGNVDGGMAAIRIDAQGMVVAPGFIDVHTHSEDIASLPVAENFLRMGVTTIVTGNCGSSATDVAKFFEKVEETKCAVNVATLVGHNSVRSLAMHGSWDRPPTAEELERMKALVDQGMRDGAMGLSTGLIYLPGTFAKPEEIIELAKVASAHGGIYASHMRAENVKIFGALNEVFRVAREAKIRAEVSHLKLSGPSAWGKADDVIAALDKARAEGLQITHDAYAYTASSTTLSQLIPDQAREGTDADFLARLEDPLQKAQIIVGMKEMLQRSGREDYRYAVIARFRPDASLAGKNIAEAAKILRGSDTLDDQMETILDIHRRGSGSGVFHGMSEADLQNFLRHPLTMIASDGGPRSCKPSADASHPRSYGNNARVLARYVREQKILSLEEAVRRMTSLPAQTFRMLDRGSLRVGACADIVIFDPDKVNDKSTYDDPHHVSEGFTDVIVNGVVVLQNNTLTGERSGRVLRGQRALIP
jgi:N-acyl-D-amino-acid deacylase